VFGGGFVIMCVLEVFRDIRKNLEFLLQPLVDEGLIEELVFGKKSRGKVLLPNLKIVFGDATRDTTTLGAIGNRTLYKMDLILISTVKNTLDPYQGDLDALNIISQAQNILLGNRHLNIPSIVHSVEDNIIKQDPQSWNEKITLYRRGTIFQVSFIVNNL
jgi:hypothetical protein